MSSVSARRSWTQYMSRLRLAEADPDLAVRVTRRWVEKTVMGVPFCPFAAKYTSQTEIIVAPSAGEMSKFANKRAAMLASNAGLAPVTTLVVCPFPQVAEWEAHNRAGKETQYRMMRAQLFGPRGPVHLIPFHPLAVRIWDGIPMPDCPGNYVARSPLPMFHLLRQTELDYAEKLWTRGGRQAAVSLPGGAGASLKDLQDANVHKAHDLGQAKLEQLIDECWEDGPDVICL